jgi:hypothetical protein
LKLVDSLEVSGGSKALYDKGGRGGKWVDRTARQRRGADPKDEKHHLAKVRVAGSNPVFLSIVVAGESLFFNPEVS